MAKREKDKIYYKGYLKSSIIGAFQKLDLRYMVKKSGHVCCRYRISDHIAFDDISDIVWRQCRISRV